MNTFYNNWRKWQIKRASEGREKNRSFGQQLFPVYISVTIGTALIHLVSFVAATIYPSYLIEISLGNAVVGFIIGAAFVLLFVEIPKYVFIKTVFENFFDSEIKSYGLALCAAALIGVSIFSSTYGIELAVKWLSPDAELESVEAIEKKYNGLIAQAKDYWQPKVDKYDTQAKEYFKTNAKYYASEDRTRLSSSKAIQQPYNKILTSLKESETALTKRLDQLQQEKQKYIERAETENDKTKSKHEDSKYHASIVAFWGMLAFELLYIFGIAFIAYYADRGEKELHAPDEATPNNTGKVVAMNGRTEPNQQTKPRTQQNDTKVVAEKQQESNKIGFKSHGSVFIPDGGTVPKVWYQTTKGSWSAYSESDLKRMIKKPTGSEDWKNELKGLVEKLENFNAKNK